MDSEVQELNSMPKLIVLTQGKSAVVDDEDFKNLSKYNWYYGAGGYAVRKEYLPNGTTKDIFMHRAIINTPDHFQTDHIDGDTLNNQKNNLRQCTNQQNQGNQKIRKENVSSKYKGVVKRKNGWEANICINKKVTYLGLYSNEVAAANAYNRAAINHFGEFARLNDIPIMDELELKLYKNKINKKSKYIGVHWSTKMNKWEASFYINKKQKFLGYFETENDALKSRNGYILTNGIDINKLQEEK